MVVTRARATVPGCPDLRSDTALDWDGKTSSNHGCAINRNLAAMVANPTDLVQGVPGAATSDTETGTRGSRPCAPRRRRGVAAPRCAIPIAARAAVAAALPQEAHSECPWKPAMLTVRDPFLAFVSDDWTVEAIRPLVAEQGWSVDKVMKGGLSAAIQSLSVLASPQILLVDLTDTDDPASEIGNLAEVCEPGTIVIAVGSVNDVRLYRSLIASGLHDYLLKPINADQLRETIAQARTILHAPAPWRWPRKGDVQRRGGRRAWRRGRLDRCHLARLADGGAARPDDGAARPGRAFRHRRAGVGPGAGTRAGRCDR
ncbi:hypothetical protein GCM10020258_05270 [Sphingomonas yabuuchiae]